MKSSVFAILAFFNLAHLRERIISVAMPAIAFVTSHLFSASVQVDRALVPPTEFVYDAPRCPPYVSRLLRKQVSPVPVIPPAPQPVCINRHLVPSFEVPGPISPAPSPWPFPPSAVKLDARSSQIPISWLLVALVVISALSLWVYARLKLKHIAKRPSYRYKLIDRASESPSTPVFVLHPRKKVVTQLNTGFVSATRLSIPVVICIPPPRPFLIATAHHKTVKVDLPSGHVPCPITTPSNGYTPSKPVLLPVQCVDSSVIVPIKNAHSRVPALVDDASTQPSSAQCEERTGETYHHLPSSPNYAPASIQEYQEKAPGIGASIWANVSSPSSLPSPAASSPSPTFQTEPAQSKSAVVSAFFTPSMEDFIERGSGTAASIWALSAPQSPLVAETTTAATPLTLVTAMTLSTLIDELAERQLGIDASMWASPSPSPLTATKTMLLVEVDVPKPEFKPTSPIEEFKDGQQDFNALIWASSSPSPLTVTMVMPLVDVSKPESKPTPPMEEFEDGQQGLNASMWASLIPSPPTAMKTMSPVEADASNPTAPTTEFAYGQQDLNASMWASSSSPSLVAPKVITISSSHAPVHDVVPTLLDFPISSSTLLGLGTIMAHTPPSLAHVEVVVSTLSVSQICPSGTLGSGVSESMWAPAPSTPTSPQQQVPHREQYIQPLFNASASAPPPMPEKTTPSPTQPVSVKVVVLTPSDSPICPSEILSLGVSASIWASEPSEHLPVSPQQCSAPAALLASLNSTPPPAPLAPVVVTKPLDSLTRPSATLSLGASASIWASVPGPSSSLSGPSRTQYHSRPTRKRYIKQLYTAPAAPVPGRDTLLRVPLRSLVSGLPVGSSSENDSRTTSGIPRAVSNRGSVSRGRSRGRGNRQPESTRWVPEGKENQNSR